MDWGTWLGWISPLFFGWMPWRRDYVLVLVGIHFHQQATSKATAQRWSKLEYNAWSSRVSSGSVGPLLVGAGSQSVWDLPRFGGSAGWLRLFLSLAYCSPVPTGRTTMPVFCGFQSANHYWENSFWQFLCLLFKFNLWKHCFKMISATYIIAVWWTETFNFQNQGENEPFDDTSRDTWMCAVICRR